MATAFEARTSVSNPANTPVEQIARSTGKSVAIVQEMYDRTLQSLSSSAKITQFVGVIATRRVMLQLSKR